MWLITVTLLGVLTVLLLARIKRKRTVKAARSFPPAPPWTLPVIGNLHQLGTHPFKTFMRWQAEYGDIFTVQFGPIRGVVINEAAAIREAYSRPELSARPKLKPFLERFGDGGMRGLIFNDGPSWTAHRRFVLRTLRDFGFGKSACMEQIIQAEVNHAMAEYEERVGAGAVFSGKHFFSLVSLNTLWMLMCGERFEYHDQELRRLSEMFTSSLLDNPAAGLFFFFPTLSRLLPNWTGYNAFMAPLRSSHAIMTQQHAKARFGASSGCRPHFIDKYIERVQNETDPNSPFHGALGEEHMIACLSDLFTAGIETTGTTLAWTFLLLMLNPAVQDKIHQEIVAVLGGESTTPSLGDRERMPYLEATLHEVIRFSSLFPLSLFHAASEDLDFRGFRISKDTLIVANLYGVHFDPVVWGDPDVFRPERFLQGGCGIEVALREQVLGFSCGKRVCIGEVLARNVLFLFLARVLQKFEIMSPPTGTQPSLDYVPSFILQLRPYEYMLKERRRTGETQAEE